VALVVDSTVPLMQEVGWPVAACLQRVSCSRERHCSSWNRVADGPIVGDLEYEADSAYDNVSGLIGSHDRLEAMKFQEVWMCT
jgi:hypothetical protein